MDANLISRDAAIEALSKAEQKAFNDFYDRIIKARKFIEELPAVPDTRLLKLDEIKESDLVYVERRHDTSGYAECQDIWPDYCFFVSLGNVSRLMTADYGVTWRCWTRKSNETVPWSDKEFKRITAKHMCLNCKYWSGTCKKIEVSTAFNDYCKAWESCAEKIGIGGTND